ncbi:sensor histidine kinase [Pseudidiomarina aestuarii]|uniref:sensor histidine kinase n=1 Tax=Pseudidiomarina aestuarii TaxID=624146 RepID=UPI003A974093
MSKLNFTGLKHYRLAVLLPLLTALVIEVFLSLQASSGSALNAFSFARFLLLAGILIFIYWLHLVLQRSSQSNKRMVWFRYLASLDAALVVLLLVWTVFMTSLFVYNPDPMRNQPLEPVFDPILILQEWQLSLHYFWQFGVMAAIIFFYYWMNRYQFIRKVLAQHGVYVYLLSSSLWLLLTYPVFAWLVLQLPLTIPEQSLLPSEDHNIFAAMNLFAAVSIWALTAPVILAFERQQGAKEVAELKQQQVQAELKMLQQQVNPHFLFNTLNSLYALCLTGASNAAPMLLNLADLLRYVVYEGQKSRVLLSEDLDYLKNYIELQRMRLGDRCQLTWQIDVSDTQAKIAPLLLVMLVENAFKHGIEPSAAAGRIDIHANLGKGEFVFSCMNSLADSASAKHKHKHGIGLENLRRRLQLTYPGQHNLTSQQNGSLWQAELRIVL